MKQCKECGNDFEPKNPKGVFCSTACRQKDYRKKIAENLRFLENNQTPTLKVISSELTDQIAENNQPKNKKRILKERKSNTPFKGIIPTIEDNIASGNPPAQYTPSLLEPIIEIMEKIAQLKKQPPSVKDPVSLNLPALVRGERQKSIDDQIKAVKAEKVPKERDTSNGRKSWAYDQQKRIKDLEIQLK